MLTGLKPYAILGLLMTGKETRTSAISTWRSKPANITFLLCWLFSNAVSINYTVSDDSMINECTAVGGMKIWQEKPKHSEITCHKATLPTTNST
jgi:hypothetical protein